MFREYLFGRLTSKTFVVPFVIVTLLCAIDLLALSWAGAGGLSLLPYGSDIGYGTVLSLYGLCIIEAFGMSVFVKFAAALWARARHLLTAI